MSTQSNDYHISFFKPTTPRAKANRNMVIWLFSIWAVTIFGFQILLKVMEKPVAEETLNSFNAVWANVESGNASSQELQVFAQSSLSVLSKVMIAPADKDVLDNALSWSVYTLADSVQQESIKSDLADFVATKEKIEDITDPAYIKSKIELEKLVSPIIGLSQNDARTKILPLELVSDKMMLLTPENKAQIPQIMGLYLTHNRSVLTDVTFLGFPFHYFYTAVFLLILFVGLCWLYCVKTDSVNKEFDIED